MFNQSQYQSLSAVRYVRDRPNLKPITPCSLLKPISLAHELCSTAGILDVEKEQNNEIDFEMGSNSGNMCDNTNSGLCLVFKFWPIHKFFDS